MMDPSRLIPGDATLIENIVSYLKAKGIFDEFRHECLADVDTKSSFQNLNQRVDGYTSKFLATETWNPDLNKNDLRNKLRRHIDESGMLAVGADHVVEQVINPKIHTFFLPKIIEVVHQFLREQSELFNKKSEAPNDNSAAEKPVIDVSDGNPSKVKTVVLDPIADILSFSYSKTKPTAPGGAQGKAESAQQKHVDLKKKREDETTAEKKKREDESVVEKKKREEESAAEKKKREEESTAEKKSITESVDFITEDQTTSVVSEVKLQSDKEKIKKEIKVEESESNQEVSRKANKEEMKLEKKKNDDGKTQNSEATIMSDDNKSDASTPVKASVSHKRPFSRPKLKSKPKDASSSKDVKKHKKESSKSLEKRQKHKPSKSIKELSSPTKTTNVSKSSTKEKISSGDSSSSKTLDKKSSKLNSSRNESNESKHKKHSEKPEKRKISKKEQFLNEFGSTEKGTKNTQYSSSHDSSQGSDQEKSLLDAKKEKKQFSKNTQKESIEKQPDKITKTLPDKKRSASDEGSMKKCKSEKGSKLDHTKVVGEAAKISSRSNSFGSTSSVSSSSNASKDNLASNSDDISENSSKDKKKKVKGKDPCQMLKTLPPPPPPPPPSGGLTMELTSSAEMSSMEDTQSSSISEKSSSEESTEESSSDSESESPLSILEALENHVPSSSVDDINDFYDIFLYSSSSEDFEGYGTSPEKNKLMTNDGNSDVSVSSVHTSDLSSFDDELSDDSAGIKPGVKKRFTLKEAQQLIQDRALLQQYRNKIRTTENKSKEDSNNALLNHEKKTSMLTSEEESSPSEPTRSLRRERKLNPRYASSEYTSIFNCKKESFITKQPSPVKKCQSPISSPIIEPKHIRRESMVERGKTTKKASSETEVQKYLEETTIKRARKEETLKEEITVQVNSKKTKVRKDSEREKADVLENLEENYVKKNSDAPKASEQHNTKINSEEVKGTESQNSNEIDVASKYLDGKVKPHGVKGTLLCTKSLNNEKEDQLSSSDEMSSIIDKEHLYRENNDKTDVLTVSDHLKVQFQFKSQNISKLNINSRSTKRKLQMEETPAAKRPCSRNSVDSSSSESVANENKPFNTGKQNLLDEKILRDHNDLKTTNLADKIKNDLFCRKNNNGDILGQKEILLNSHGKAVSVTERKAKESDSSKELNSL